MKIAFLSFYSGRIDRGVEVATQALSEHLGKIHTVTVFQAGVANTTLQTRVIRVEKDWPEDSSSSFWRLFYLDYYSRKIALFTFKFLPFFFRERYDVVIATNGGWQVVLCRLTCWIFGKKLVLQGNAGIGRDDLWQMLWWPDLYIAISPAGYTWAKSKLRWVKKTYIPYGVDLAKAQKAVPVELMLDRPVVLCVSAFLPFKRIELLIEAVGRLKNASLLLIGHGPLEKKLQTHGSKLLGRRFQLLTGVAHQNLFNYYKSADIFSLPSKESEAFGIVYVEALACGLPIVATNDYNRQKVIGPAGKLVDPTDIDRYASALDQVLHQDFGDKPLKQAQNFSWEIITQKYLEEFKKWE